MPQYWKEIYVLAIAGSDSGGGAGIQADLRAFDAMGVRGLSAISCITAQNPRRIAAVRAVDPDMISAQVEACCEYFRVKAVKTGMLYTASAIRTAARLIKRFGFRTVVVDPVLRATSGRTLAARGAFRALCDELLPLATVITPNVPEAEMILGRRIAGRQAQEAAARELAAKYSVACVIKGGHLEGCGVVDVLCWRGQISLFKAKRIKAQTHGTGCAFAAALAALLAKGIDMKSAVRSAKKHVFQLIRAQNNHRLPADGDSEVRGS